MIQKFLAANIKNVLEKANKLIFIKQYEKADKILSTAINSSQFENYLILHLRRIELAVKLQNIHYLKKQYLKKNPHGYCHIDLNNLPKLD